MSNLDLYNRGQPRPKLGSHTSKFVAAIVGLSLVAISYGGVIIYNRFMQIEEKINALTTYYVEGAAVARKSLVLAVPPEALRAAQQKPDLWSTDKWIPEWQRYLASSLATNISSVNPPPHRPPK